jgi:uncharacterized SAM-binding protein YcdF (DUF218 family)
MFILSKILGLLTEPLTWVTGLLLTGLFFRRHKPVAARRLRWSALAVLLAVGWLPLPTWLSQQLEGRYAEIAPQADLRSYVGVIVLGGATASGQVQQAHVQPLLNGAAERMTAPVAMLRRNPHLRLVFTGGEGSLFGSGPSEADRARVFFDSMGLPPDRVQYESASRSTFENAVLTAQLPGIDITQRWLLVTSAAHMPRAMATFAKAGWNATAYPVDFQTGGTTSWASYSQAGGINNWQNVLHELLGLLAYRLTGRL